MAGPRVKTGTLDEHSATAARLAKNAAKANTSLKREDHSKRETKSKAPVSKDSDSDSSSGSDSESDADAPANSSWADKIKAKNAVGGTKKTVFKVAISDSDSDSSSDSDAQSKGAKTKVKAGSESSSGSESDDSSVVKRTVIANKSKQKVVADSGSDSSSESDSDSSVKQVKITTKKVTTTTTAAPTNKKSVSTSDSDSSDAGTDDSSEDESDSGAKITKKGNQSTSETSESGSDSESESVSEKQAKTKAKSSAAKSAKLAKEAAKSKAPVKGKASSKSDEVIDSDSDSESEDEAGPSMALEKRNGKPLAQKVPEFIGQDFQLRKAVDGVDASDVARIFQNAKAEGKQIWYFTLPASLPIEVIQEHAIPLDKMHAGTPIVAYDGADYTASSDDVVDTSITVLIPNRAGNKYETLNRSIDRSVHIKKVMRFSEGDGTAAALAPKIPRAQPEGLKTRYQALGAPVGQIEVDASSDEDVEMSQAPLLLPSSETPKAGGNKKRKHGGTPNQEGTGSASAKKSKKARVDATSGSAPVPKAASPSRKSKKQTPIAPPSIPAMNGKISLPASSPVLSTRKAQSPSLDKLPSTQPTTSSKVVPKKVTPVAPPRFPGSSY